MAHRRPPQPIHMPDPKKCPLCRADITYIDYKDTGLLRKYISERGKVRARRVTGACTQHQREIAKAVKNAREMALLSYTGSTN